MNIDNLIGKYGMDMSLHMSDGWSSETYRGFLQPLRYKNKMYLQGAHFDFGINNDGYYLYIGPSNHNITALPGDAWLFADGRKYQIDRAEKVFFENNVLYYWAVMRNITEVNDDNES